MDWAMLSKKGQITIPKAVRDHLQLNPGDKVRFLRVSPDDVILQRRSSIEQLRGALKADRHVSMDEILETIRKRGSGQ